MRLKTGVNPFSLRPELLLALLVADAIWARYGHELVVTSLNDGKHSRGSLHYVGAAADLRSRNISADILNSMVGLLRQALGNNQDYDIVVEKDHVHLEWQPKVAVAL